MSPKNLIEDYSGDPYQLYGVQEKFGEDDHQARIAEEVEEVGKIDQPSDIQSQMTFDNSAESIADSDLEDGELQKMLTSPGFARGTSGFSRQELWSGSRFQHSCTISWQACRRRCHPRVLAGRLASTVSRSSRRRIRLGTVFAVIGTPRSLHAQMSAILTLLAHDATKEGVCVSPAVTLLFQCEPRPGTLSFHGNHVPTTRGAGRALELWRKLRDFVHGRTCCLMMGRSIRTLSCHSGLHVVLYKKTAV